MDFLLLFFGKKGENEYLYQPASYRATESVARARHCILTLIRVAPLSLCPALARVKRAIAGDFKEQQYQHQRVPLGKIKIFSLFFIPFKKEQFTMYISDL